MPDWADEIEAVLANQAYELPGRARRPAGAAVSALALEVAHGRATSHLLAQGIVLTTLLCRCALAEAEEEDDGGECRQELSAAAESLLADWQLLLAACRRVGVPVEQVVGEGKVSYMARSVVHLAQEIVGSLRG